MKSKDKKVTSANMIYNGLPIKLTKYDSGDEGMYVKNTVRKYHPLYWYWLITTWCKHFRKLRKERRDKTKQTT